MMRYRFIFILMLLLLSLAACSKPDAQPDQQATDPGQATETTDAPADADTATPVETEEEETEVSQEEPTKATEPVAPTSGVSDHLVVGIDPAYPPMEYVDAETLGMVGFDIDMMREIATRLNATVEFTTTAFPDLLPTLANENRFDLVVSSVAVTDEDKKLVDFSIPYFQTGQVMLVRVDSTTPMTTKADLVNAGIVGVQAGSFGEWEARNAGVAVENIRTFETVDLAVQELAVANLNVVIADGPPSAEYIAQLPDLLKVAGDTITKDKYAIAMKKGDIALKSSINVTLKQMKDDGTLQELIDKWNLQPVATIP